MKYEEICIGTRSLFQKKASAYPKNEKSGTSAIGYRQYLWMFMLLKGEETIKERIEDLIQYDLKMRKVIDLLKDYNK